MTIPSPATYHFSENMMATDLKELTLILSVSYLAAKSSSVCWRSRSIEANKTASSAKSRDSCLSFPKWTPKTQAELWKIIVSSPKCVNTIKGKALVLKWGYNNKQILEEMCHSFLLITYIKVWNVYVTSPPPRKKEKKRKACLLILR